MSRKLVLAIDQSTQGTKALLFDEGGEVVERAYRAHAQLVNEDGWVSHDAEEITTNVLACARDACKHAGVQAGEVVAVGLSNQRETCLAWDLETREPLAPAIVWQCGRARKLCERIATERPDAASRARDISGLELSPYFSAAKMAWLLHNDPKVNTAAERGTLALGTIDSWLVYKLSEERAHLSEPSNACRTQLLDIRTGAWSEELCDLFGVPMAALPQVVGSDTVFGHTTMGGLFATPVPICGVLGDSQAALAAQNCVRPGEAKATYGTGSSVMMQTGELVRSERGLVSSIAWELDGRRSYVLEGNLNYTGAVITWLKDQMGLINSPAEVEAIARSANPADRSFFVPAFTGLGAPWWDAHATGLLTGVTRTTGRAEMVRAGLDCIAYQVADVVAALRDDSGHVLGELRVDGGPTANAYLMQLQADIARADVSVSGLAELSAAGVAFVAGRAAGLWDTNRIYESVDRTIYAPKMASGRRTELVGGWHAAVRQALAHA